jgi:hypothetical protein
MNEQLAGWQGKLDRAFPYGLVASWEDRQVTYLVPRVVVTAMSGDSPVVWLPVFAGSDKVLGPLVLTSYDRVSYKVAKVTFAGVGKSMTWYAGVSKLASHAMAGERQHLTKLAPHGGEAVMHEIAGGVAA